MSGEPKTREPHRAAEGYKCRIPLRLPFGRQRPPPKPKSLNVDHVKNKTDVPAHQQANGVRCTSRPYSSEARPKSGNRPTDNVGEPAHSGTTASRSARPERLSIAQKKPQLYPRRGGNEKFQEMSSNNKTGRLDVITVPVNKKLKAEFHKKLSVNLPDQETIRRYEEMELQQEDFSDASHMFNSTNDIFMDLKEEESVTSRSDRIIQLQSCWQEQLVQFEQMKSDLHDRQNVILEIYASLRNTKDKLISMGQKSELPSTNELRIMNVANMTPNQLLQLCAENKSLKDDNQAKNALIIDMKKFNEIPLKLVATCEQTLATRKELIDWFDNLKNHEKGCSKSSLTKKINEFNAENEMLTSTLETVKNEFINDLNEVLRTCLNERVALQLRTEELICEVSELSSLNEDLKKQLYNAEKQKTHVNKMRMEELEKELKEEKIKKMTLRDRLARAEGQVKIESDRATLVESALNQARLQIRALERTVQQQQEQNQQLQKEFNVELNKLKDSMIKNTTHLEEIAAARDILQHEKEDLKKRLEELSSHYNESLATMKEELNKSVAKLIEAEKKYNDEIESKNELNKTIESQATHLLECEVRYKNTLKQLEEAERTSNELLNYKKDFEQSKCELERHKKIFAEQTARIMEMEENLTKIQELEKVLKSEIIEKDKYIVALRNKNVLLEEKSQENARKMQVYEDQLTSLKNHLSKLQEHFIEIKNLNELHELVNRQSVKLAETKRKNDEISEDLEKKQKDLQQLIKVIAEHNNLIKQKQSELKMLSEKQEEQSNIQKLNQQISEKNTEIDSLITNIERRKEQISQLEKIILTIEDQNRKFSIQNRQDQDKIRVLEQKILEYEYYIARKNNELSDPENLDKLIKILEDELGTPFEFHFITANHALRNENNNKITKHNQADGFGQKEADYRPGTKILPTKIVMGNFVKKTYIPNNDMKRHNDDNYLPRKNILRNFDPQKWIHASDDVANTFSFTDKNNILCVDGTKEFEHPKDCFLKKLPRIQVKDEKKCKMFKFASHRIT